MFYYYNEKDCKRALRQVDTQLKELQAERDRIAKDLANYQKGKPEENPDEIVWGLHWDFTYLSHYVGEHGQYKDAGSGAEEMKEEDVVRIRSLIEEEEDFEEVGRIVGEYIHDRHGYIFENAAESGTFTVSDEEIRWETDDDGEYDGEMEPGTYFEIRKSLRESIESTPYYFEEDISPN